jgi:hypothetical protein
VLPKSTKSRDSQRIWNTRPVTGSENSVSGPCTGRNTHCTHLAIVWRTSEMAKPVDKYAFTATLLTMSCLITLFFFLPAGVKVWSRLTPDSNNLIWQDRCLTKVRGPSSTCFEKNE